MSKEYIEKEAAIGIIKSYRDCGFPMEDADTWEIQDIERLEPADVVPVVRCKDCKYWKDRHIKLCDGTERQYTESDGDYVTQDVGVNVEAKCHYEDGRGWMIDKSVFRNAEDYCSRGAWKEDA